MIRVLDHDPVWAENFARLRDLLRADAGLRKQYGDAKPEVAAPVELLG